MPYGFVCCSRAVDLVAVRRFTIILVLRATAMGSHADTFCEAWAFQLRISDCGLRIEGDRRIHTCDDFCIWLVDSSVPV
jgi:hypothetical protein